MKLIFDPYFRIITFTAYFLFVLANNVLAIQNKTWDAKKHIYNSTKTITIYQQQNGIPIYVLANSIDKPTDKPTQLVINCENKFENILESIDAKLAISFIDQKTCEDAMFLARQSHEFCHLRLSQDKKTLKVFDSALECANDYSL